MTNVDRIQANNVELREAIQMAENLPDAAGGSDVQKSTIGNLKLFDVVKFGRWDGRDVYWFVSDTDYEGHTILTVMPDVIFELEMCKISALEDEKLQAKYRFSSLRQFLNAETNVWFSEKYIGDEPTSYSSKPGFLCDFTQSERDAIKPMELKAVEYNSSDGYDIITYTDMVWIPSKKQCGGTAGTAEGSRAFEATSISANIAWFSLICTEVFLRTRTTDSWPPHAQYSSSDDGSYTPSNNYVSMPISVSLKRDTNVRGIQLLEPGSVLWEAKL